ncbi:MAG: alpha/beta fold hydrolase [Actinomycetia bacterium]|nr:alpha/beta fold hydrolase [Actinomycetes bacterium]
MTFSSGTFTSPDDQLSLGTYVWGGDQQNLRGVIQIAHGLAEHSARYARLAEAFTEAGYAVAAIDHRGHGTSIAEGAVPGDFGDAGWAGLVNDLVAYGAYLQHSHPDLPRFLFAHSMGSFAAQSAILEHSDLWDGVVLSGSTALDALAQSMAEAAEAGQPAGLEAFNAGFEHRTGYEWLSRDEAAVDQYVADPLCGFDVPEQTMPQLFSQTELVANPEILRGIRGNLPLLLLSGDADPLAGGGQLIELLAQRYRDAGVSDVTVRLYPEGRHEMLNELNRDDVVSDVVEWVRAHTDS